ncbi:MAG: HAD-IIIA family hydrolase [Thermoplasmatota archaeon]
MSPSPDAAPFTVFLDRDGVFNVDPQHAGGWPLQIRKPSQFTWQPGAREAFARLNRPDVQTCLATNQPGTALGLSTKGMIRRLHTWMQGELAAAGGRLDQVQACFAPPGLPHRRRKPRGGMLADGAAAFPAFDPERAVMIGDKVRDAGAAADFGIPAVLVATSRSEAELRAGAEAKGYPLAAVVPGLPEAVDWVLDRLPND